MRTGQVRFGDSPWQRAYNAEAEALSPEAFLADGTQIRLLTEDEHRACVAAADRIAGEVSL